MGPAERITDAPATPQALWASYGVSPELLELRNLVAVGQLILMSGLARRESRGGHFCLDYPSPALNHPRTTVIGGVAKTGAATAPKQASGLPATAAKGPSSSLVRSGSVVPLRGKLGSSGATKKAGGLIERSRAREVALRSQRDDLE